MTELEKLMEHIMGIGIKKFPLELLETIIKLINIEGDGKPHGVRKTMKFSRNDFKSFLHIVTK